jgi:hypothetical protein
MRVKPGSTTDEAFAALSKRQQTQVLTIEAARAVEDEKVRAVLHKSREAIRKALASGVPARVIASRLGVSPARIYQMRDEAVAYTEVRDTEKEQTRRSA